MTFATPIGFPVGGILTWHGLIADIPTGWSLCDGTGGTSDLRSKFIRGAPAATEAGGTGGADTHTLTIDELPSHDHTAAVRSVASSPVSRVVSSAGSGKTANADSVGSGAAHNNMPAYYEILYIEK